MEPGASDLPLAYYTTLQGDSGDVPGRTGPSKELDWYVRYLLKKIRHAGLPSARRNISKIISSTIEPYVFVWWSIYPPSL
jgi:hypothetical protein